MNLKPSHSSGKHRVKSKDLDFQCNACKAAACPAAMCIFEGAIVFAAADRTN